MVYKNINNALVAQTNSTDFHIHSCMTLADMHEFFCCMYLFHRPENLRHSQFQITSTE